MIKANELRIGNWVQSDDKIADKWQIERIEKDEDMFANGVPLTAEILEQCGFTKDRTGFSLEDKMSLSFSVTKDGMFLPCWLDKALYPNAFRITEYVHQLQNLYFALTGEELEIDL